VQGPNGVKIIKAKLREMAQDAVTLNAGSRQ
jgi:hypothetical protein